MLKSKPNPNQSIFIMDDELYFAQDEDAETIDGYLLATKPLVDRLKEYVSSEHSTEEMESMDNVNFYPVYNAWSCTVELQGTYYYFDGNDEKQKDFILPLTQEEKADLIDIMEDHCLKLYGHSCTVELNQFRMSEGLTPISTLADDLAAHKPAFQIVTYQKNGSRDEISLYHDIDSLLQDYLACKTEAKESARPTPTIWAYDNENETFQRIHDFSFREVTPDTIQKYLSERILDSDDLLNAISYKPPFPKDAEIQNKPELLQVLHEFEEYGWEGSFTAGPWNIENEYADEFSFELFYDNQPAALCVNGKLSLGSHLNDKEKQLLGHTILNAFDNLDLAEPLRAPEKTSVIPSKKWFLEMIQDFSGTYCANLTINGKRVEGLPEYVDYSTLKNAIKKKTGIEILKRKDMLFSQSGWKKYAYIDATQELKDCRIPLSEINKGWKPDFGNQSPSIDDMIQNASGRTGNRADKQGPTHVVEAPNKGR